MISFLVKIALYSYSSQNAGEPIEPSKIFTPVFEKLEGYAEGIVGGGWLWVGHLWNPNVHVRLNNDTPLQDRPYWRPRGPN